MCTFISHVYFCLYRVFFDINSEQLFYHLIASTMNLAKVLQVNFFFQDPPEFKYLVLLSRKINIGSTQTQNKILAGFGL